MTTEVDTVPGSPGLGSRWEGRFAIGALAVGVVSALALMLGVWAVLPPLGWVLFALIPLLGILGAAIALGGMVRASARPDAERDRKGERRLGGLCIANVAMLLFLVPIVWGVVVLVAGP